MFDEGKLLSMMHNISLSEDTKLFQEYPEALHKADAQQCKKFNEQLMKKIIVEKKKKNSKFVDSKMMDECFKFYRPHHSPDHAEKHSE